MDCPPEVMLISAFMWVLAGIALVQKLGGPFAGAVYVILLLACIEKLPS